MSLQAKIEAVIYASEEPVTLAQLMGLLGEEAQAELDEQDARQATLLLDVPEDAPGEADGDEDALNAEVLEGDPELERETAASAEPEATEPQEAAAAPDSQAEPEPDAQPEARENAAAA